MQSTEECVVYRDLAHEFECKFGAANSMHERMIKRLAELEKEANQLRLAVGKLDAAIASTVNTRGMSR